MGKSAKTAPVPDYNSAALNQAAVSKQNIADQLRANRPSQSSTEGNMNWSQDPSGNWTQTSTLNQPNQDLYNQQLGNQQGIADKSGQMINNFDTSQVDFSGAPKMGEVGGFNQQATDLYNQLAQPGLDRQVNSQRARAAAMGIPEFGSRAGDSMNQQLGDMTSRSGMMGAQAGIQQGNTMFGQQNALHQQGVSDILGQRQANLGNLTGLMGLGRQQSANPAFNPFGSAGLSSTPDLMGAATATQKAQQDAINAKNASSGQLLGGLGSLAGSVFGPVGAAAGGALAKGMFG